MSGFDHQVQTRVDGLIAMCADRASALRAAADAIDNGELARSLRWRADRWAYLKDELRTAIRELGGTPRDGGSVTGALHRTWIYVKAAANEAEAIRQECARREAAAVHMLQESSQEELPARLHAVVERFLVEVSADNRGLQLA